MYHDINRIVLTGRVHEAPDIRFDDVGEPYTMFLLACVPRPKPTSERPPELFWMRANGERLATLCNALLPGTRVLVEGRLQTSANDMRNEGVWHGYEVRVQHLIVLQSPPDSFGRVVPLPRAPSPATTDQVLIISTKG